MKKSINKQEELVSALWDFAYDLQTMKSDSSSESFDGKKKTKMNMKAIGKAIKRIMDNFGYQITPIY